MGNLHLSKCLKAICCTAAVLVAGAFSGYAQGTVTVSGTVTDAEGLPLIGAGVLVDGSTTGVSTDFDGNYTITAPADASLRFTYISMTDAVEPINGRSVINVVLHNETTALDAVVVTAMGISKSEKSLSYNVQQAKLENVVPVPEHGELAYIADLLVHILQGGITDPAGPQGMQGALKPFCPLPQILDPGGSGTLFLHDQLILLNIKINQYLLICHKIT